MSVRRTFVGTAARRGAAPAPFRGALLLAALAGLAAAALAVPGAATAASPSALSAATAGVAAQDAAQVGAGLSEAELDALSAEVADQLRCPVCRNQSVLESPTELAREMQGVIRERLAAGESPEEVKAYFVSRYGEWILLRPEPKGMNLLVYVLPALVLLAGGVLVWHLLRRWTAGAPPAAASDGEAEAEGAEEERRWLEEAIRSG